MVGNGLGYYFPGWGVSVRNGVLVNGMGFYFPGWGVTLWDKVLVNGIECSYIGCVSKQDGLLYMG